MIKVPYSPLREANRTYPGGAVGNYECLICGSRLNDRSVLYAVHLTTDGMLVNERSIESDRDWLEANLDKDQGWFPLGASCLDSHPELKAYAEVVEVVAGNMVFVSSRKTAIPPTNWGKKREEFFYATHRTSANDADGEAHLVRGTVTAKALCGQSLLPSIEWGRSNFIDPLETPVCEECLAEYAEVLKADEAKLVYSALEVPVDFPVAPGQIIWKNDQNTPPAELLVRVIEKITEIGITGQGTNIDRTYYRARVSIRGQGLPSQADAMGFYRETFAVQVSRKDGELYINGILAARPPL